jgi:hypothetical protein
MSHHTEKSFDGMQFNPLSLKKGQYVEDRFPQLMKIEGINEILKRGNECQAIIKYVLLAFTFKNNPLVVEYADNLLERRSAAAELVGYERDGKFKNKSIQDIIEGIDEEVNLFSFGYLKFQKNKLWAHICSQEFRFWEAQQLMLNPIKIDDDKKMLDAATLKGKLADDCDKMAAKIEELWNELLGDHKDILTEEMLLTPETMYSLKKS